MFELGRTFDSYEEFQSELSKYQNEHYYNFSISDCRTLESARKRYPKLDKNSARDNLKYYCVKFTCVHGGVFKKRKNCLEQRSTSTMRLGCPAFIYLRVNSDCTKLEVAQMHESHNHPTSQTLYNNLPNQRRLTPQTRSEVVALMDMKADKKLIQAKIQSETGQCVTMKDLHNVYSTAKQNTKSKCFVDVVDDLRSVYKCDVEILPDSNGSLSGIFIQDERMKREFRAFPEVVCADATHKLTDIRIPLYVLLIEDGNGQNEIAAIGLLVDERPETLRWFFQKFKDRNAASSTTRAFVTDNDINAVIKSLFPGAKLVICLYHVLRTFNRAISSGKMGITHLQRDSSKKYCEQLCYAKSEIDYQIVYKKFVNEAPTQVTDYFNENWHGIRSQWVKGLVRDRGSFFNLTNNRLESFNARLKSVIPAFSNLTELFKQLFIILKCLRNERDRHLLEIVQKCPTTKFNDINTYQYYTLLTPYAFNRLKKHLSSTNVNVPDCTTIQFCGCGFFKSMRLPCKHIIAKRRQTNNPAFDESLCDRRWTKEYYLKSHTVFMEQPQNETLLNDAVNITVQPHIQRKILSCHEKYRKASISGLKLAEIMSVSSQTNFERRLQQLENIISIWSKGEEFSMQNVSSQMTDDATEEVQMVDLDDVPTAEFTDDAT